MKRKLGSLTYRILTISAEGFMGYFERDASGLMQIRFYNEFTEYKIKTLRQHSTKTVKWLEGYRKNPFKN
jgi:hypothetical protein